MAGIYGAQIFRADDRPRYRRAFAIGIAVLAAGLAVAIARYIDDLYRRRKAKAQGKALNGGEVESDANVRPGIEGVPVLALGSVPIENIEGHSRLKAIN